MEKTLKQKVMLISASVVGGIILLLAFICTHYVGPGYCGVVVNTMDKNSDINDIPIGVGISFLAPWKNVYHYPMFEQNVRWEGNESFSFQTCEGQIIWAEMGVTFHIEPSAAPMLLRKYRSGLDEISQKFIRNYLRDAMNIEASKRKVEDLYSVQKEEILLAAQNTLIDKLGPIGITITRVYLLGQFNLPEGITRALNQKMEAGQRAQQRQTEIMEAKAQAQKKIAEADGEAQSILLKANAEAKANKVLAESLTPELIQYHSLQVWDGKLPQVNGGNSMPFIKLGKDKK